MIEQKKEIELPFQPIVHELIEILEKHKDEKWAKLLEESLNDANRNAQQNLSHDEYKRYKEHPAKTLKGDEYFIYLNWMVKW